jgi:hypothetical protein
MIKLIIAIIIIFSSTCSAGEFFHRFHKTYRVKSLANERTVSVGLVLISLTRYNSVTPDDSIYNLVMSCSKEKPFGDDHGRSTNVHETVHGINNILRNQYKKEYNKNINGFYAGDGYGIILENPKLTLRDIVPYIPDALRGYRYELYFVKQLGDWNDTPTYPIDEWSAYIAGAECAVDDISRGIPIQKSDYVSGALEFSVYCTALAMAVKDKDINYWNNNIQFKNTIQYFLIKAEKVYAEGCDKFPSEKQDILLNNLRNNKDSENLRQFLLNEFQGIFVD